MQEKETEGERVVPISELFYEDGGPTGRPAAPQPADLARRAVPTGGREPGRASAPPRRRRARRRDDLARDQVRRALRQALRGLRQAAESYGERDVAEFVASHNDDVVRLDARALDSLDEIAGMLAQPAPRRARSAHDFARCRPRRSPLRARRTPRRKSRRQHSGGSRPNLEAPSAAGHDAGSRRRPSLPRRPPRRSAIAPPQQRWPKPRRPSPRQGRRARIAARCGDREARGAADDALATPVSIPEQPPVPIDVLLYRGRAAIERCREIRDQVRSAGGPVDAETLGELFDLLDLALTD